MRTSLLSLLAFATAIGSVTGKQIETPVAVFISEY
jgi:hypothetical protein